MPLNIVYTAQASAIVHCMAGTGDAVSASALAESIISQRDADRKALSLAQARAQEALNCTPIPTPVAEVFYNDEQSVSDTCSTGKADFRPPFDPSRVFTAVVAAGAVYSTVSKDEANAAALLRAQYTLLEELLGYCQVFYKNTEQSATYTCPMPQEGSNSATVPADTYVDFVSQASVDATALAAAQAAAFAGVTCVQRYYNTRQQANVACEAPLIGPGGVGVVEAGVYLDYTQEDADASAYADALAAATADAAEKCIVQYANTEQTFSTTCEEVYGAGWAGPPSSATTPANTYFSTISQADADAKALAAAEIIATTNLTCTRV